MSNDLHSESTYTHACGKRYDVRWYYDYDFGSPLDNSDMHGVTERLDWNPTNAEQLEQHILDYEPEVEEVARLTLMRQLTPPSRAWDTGLYYDVLSSLNIAKTEWGCKTHEECVEAVERDFAYLKGWYDDEWHWLTIGVAPLDEDGQVIEDERCYCSGFESTILDEDEKYIVEIIEDKIHEVEWARRRAAHPNQLELAL